MRKLLLILTAILTFAKANAESVETVEVDGIKYELHESSDLPSNLSSNYPNYCFFGDRYNQNWCAVVGYQSLESEFVTIPSLITHDGVEYTVRYIFFEAFAQCASLKNINLPNTLIGIGSGAFYKSGLTSINLQNTMVDIIPNGCFSSCEQLSEVNLGQRIGEFGIYVFENCNNIKTLKLSTSNLYSNKIKSLPPNLESLYLTDFTTLPKMDYSNTTLYAPANALSKYIDKYADDFKGFKVWDFEVADSIICDYDGERIDVLVNSYPSISPTHTNCIVAYVNHPIRIPFSVKPVNTLFKALGAMQYSNKFEPLFEYDGEDAIIVTFRKSYYVEKDIYESYEILNWDVFTKLEGSDMPRITTSVPIIVLPDPDYPTSLQFKNSEVRIKPFEFYFQPVEILPEGSTSPELTWSTSDPSMASVTQEGKVYPLVEEGTVTISVTDGKNLSASYTAIIDVNATGIEEVTVDGYNTPVEYYNLNGIRVAADALTPGLYVRRQGSKSEKFIVK